MFRIETAEPSILLAFKAIKGCEFKKCFYFIEWVIIKKRPQFGSVFFDFLAEVLGIDHCIDFLRFFLSE